MPKLVKIGFVGNIASKSEREKYTGVLRYAAEHPHVIIEEFNPTPFAPDISRRLIRRWSPDGIIVSSPSGYPYVRGLFNGMPIGLIDAFEDIKPVSDVRFILLPDETTLAQTVARYYLRRNFKAFAYLGYADKSRSALRERSYAETIRSAGFDVSVFTANWCDSGNLTATETSRLHRWLTGLVTPCAAFVYWDYLAKQVLAACAELGISVPEQLSLISVDNEEFVCENTRPTLSSVELDFQSVGYEAAKRMHMILSGRLPRLPLRETVYGMSRLVERVSSSDREGTARILTIARELIRTQSCRGLTSASIAKRLNISQRYLEIKFRQTLGTTPCNEIRKRRLEEAKRLLLQTKMSLEEIARRSGFHTLHHLQNIFSSHVGSSMKSFRDSGGMRQDIAT